MQEVTVKWDDKEVRFQVEKLVTVDIEKPVLNIERLPSGSFRLIITKSLLEE